MLTKEWVRHTILANEKSKAVELIIQATEDAEREKAEQLMTWLDDLIEEYQQPANNPQQTAYLKGWKHALNSVRDHVFGVPANGRPL